jgi:SAM-dependent methyltransferase
MPFRAAFDCLWCGSSYATRSGTDIEGWAQLCPDCVGKAGDNGFLRFRLRQALTERSAGAQPVVETAAAVATASPAAVDVDRSLIEYYEARAPEYDDWYLRRGRYERGAIHDAAWNAELDAAGRWLDALPWHGDIVELAAGTGWWSPLLASRGELSLYDTSAAALDRARERLLAHGLRAHLHVRDAWAEPDRRVDGLFMGFWLSHVARDRLRDFLALAHRWLKPGGRLAFIDSLPDPASGAVDHPAPKGDRALRRLDDGREFTIVKVFHDTHDLGEALDEEGFPDFRLSTTGRFFVLGTAVAGRESA